MWNAPANAPTTTRRQAGATMGVEILAMDVPSRGGQVFPQPQDMLCLIALHGSLSRLLGGTSFGRSLTIPPPDRVRGRLLPSASTYANVENTLAGFMYRGLTPHKFTPMPGVPPKIQADGAIRGHGTSALSVHAQRCFGAVA